MSIIDKLVGYNGEPDNKLFEVGYITTGIVTSLSPLQVKLIPSDDAIDAICLANNYGIQIGNKVFIIKYGRQILILGVVVDNVVNDKYIRCMIRKDSAQSIPSASTTKLTFSSSDVEYDPMEMFDDANDSIVIPSDGWYEITCGGRYVTSSTNGRLLYVYHNGDQLTGRGSGHDGGGRWGGLFSVNVELSTDDYLQMYTYQSSGGALNFGGSNPYNTFFSVIKI